MNWVDYAIIGLLVLSTLISLVRGFVKEALSLVIWIGACIITAEYYSSFSEYITGIENTGLRNAVSALSLFIAVLLLGALINFLVGQFVEKTGLSGTDRLLGLLFGLLRGIFIIVVFIYLTLEFTPLSQSTAWQKSRLLPYFQNLVDPLFNYLNQHLPSFHEAPPSEQEQEQENAQTPGFLEQEF